MDFQQDCNKWRQLCIGWVHFSIIQMNPSFGSSAIDKSSATTQYYPTQPALNTPNHSYKIHVNPAPQPIQITTQSGHRQVSKPHDDFNHRPASNFTSTPTIPKATNGFSSLSSYARQVKETTEQKEKNDGQSLVTVNNMDKYANTYAKYSGLGGKDYKMASSAIFPNSNQQSQFNRFPAFNLGWNQNTHQPQPVPNFTSPSSSNTSDATKPIQTAKQKRERELMEIKKQLDELNRKMMMNTEKNKNNSINDFNPQQLRPAKSSAVSHSAIFQPNPSQSFNYQNSDPKPTGYQSMSIEQLFLQKKQNDPQKQQPGKQSSLTVKQSTVPSYSFQKATTYNDWQSSNPIKAYEEKKIEESKPIVPQSYSNISQKSEQMPEKTYKYDYANNNFSPTYANPRTEPFSYSNAYSAAGQTDKMASSGLPENKQFQSTFQAQTKTPVYNFSKPTEYSSTKPQNSNSKQNQQTSQIFTHKKQVSEAGFKKKKGAATEYVDIKAEKIDMKQAVVYPETSTSIHSQASSHNQHIKRTESLDYQDPSISLPELKQFKISDFVIGKKMGKGQFGEVMLVRHKETGWVCGLKVMNKKQIRDQDYAGQIARQLSIQFYLSHRNITHLYGYFADEKNFYLLIEFCTGGQLLEKLKQQHRMNERDVSIIIRQVCQGLDYIHKQLIIHRDIKPENILFNHGVAKICDFGWAVYRGFGMRKTASGSPLYYPPQIVKGQSYDDKIDIWCIGMMTYECILGKIPFRVYTEMDLGRIVSDQITFPSWVDVTDDAKDFILKTMKKKGDQRMEIKQILRHPFITKHQEKQMSPAILEQFKRVIF